MTRPYLPLILAVCIAGCVQPAPVPPAPRPPTPVLQPTPTPPAPVATALNWLDWPIAAGDWVYRQDERGSIALFGIAGADADFIIRCDRNLRKIFVSRAGASSSGAILRVHTSSGQGVFTLLPIGGQPAYMASDVAPYDELLDKIISSRGRFAVTANGLGALAIPAWAEFARVVEDCRS